MKIYGHLTNLDYLNCLKFTQVKSPYLTFASFIAGGTAVGLASFTGSFINGKDGIRVSLLVTIVLFFFSIIYLKIRNVIYYNVIKTKMTMNNIGDCTYEIVDGRIEFSGTMYNCSVPVKNIRNIHCSNGTTYLEFSDFAGFIIPKEVKQGDIDKFKSLLEEIRDGKLD